MIKPFSVYSNVIFTDVLERGGVAFDQLQHEKMNLIGVLEAVNCGDVRVVQLFRNDRDGGKSQKNIDST